jgi:hypothetical protein
MAKMKAEMFDANIANERIGEYEKNKYLVDNLAGVDKYFRKRMKRYTTEFSYDVMANEIAYFKTINYTEYATSFMMCPLSHIMREQSIRDAYYDDESEDYPLLDWVSYFKNNVENKVSNKYEDRVDFTKDPKYDRDIEALVVLPGSNKIKSRVCLNKLKTIKERHGDKVLFKPHPITQHQIIGELKDLFGESCILPREADLYAFMMKVPMIYSTNISESSLYAVCLGKQLDHIEVHQDMQWGSFYHMNWPIFQCEVRGQDTHYFINKVLSSPKCGIINPKVDKNWKRKINDYLTYIHKERELWYEVFVRDDPIVKPEEFKKKKS